MSFLLSQEVVSNLMISKIEVREDSHPDVVKHVHPRHVEIIRVPMATGEIEQTRSFLCNVLRDCIAKLVNMKVSICDQQGNKRQLLCPFTTTTSFMADRSACICCIEVKFILYVSWICPDNMQPNLSTYQATQSVFSVLGLLCKCQCGGSGTIHFPESKG